MARLDSFAGTLLERHELTDYRENHSLEFGAPPLAPVGTTALRHPEFVARKRAVYAHEDALNGPEPDDLLDGPGRHDLLNSPEQHDLLNGPEQNDLSGTRRRFSLRQKLAAGTAIIAAFGPCAYAYFVLAPPTDKTIPQKSVEASAAVEPVFATSVKTTVAASGSSAEADASEPASSMIELLPADPVNAFPAAEPVEASQQAEPVGISQIASAASSTIIQPPETVAVRTEGVLFLQRPGVHIRSTPSKSGTGLGTAPKGTRFKVLSREADWIQVQNGRLKGWINAQFLAPTEPR